MDAIPELVRQEVVMSQSQVDGQSLTTYRFSSADSPQRLGSEMVRRFQAAGRHVIELTRGEWKIVSARDGHGIDTIQLRATRSGSEGLATQWRMPLNEPQNRSAGAHPSDVDVTAWLPEKARILRRVSHADPGRRAGTVVAMVDDDPGLVASHLRRNAQSRGFAVDPALAMPAQGAAWFRGGEHGSGEAIALRRQDEEVIATVSRHQTGCALVIHWSRAK